MKVLKNKLFICFILLSFMSFSKNYVDTISTNIFDDIQVLRYSSIDSIKEDLRIDTPLTSYFKRDVFNVNINNKIHYLFVNNKRQCLLFSNKDQFVFCMKKMGFEIVDDKLIYHFYISGFDNIELIEKSKFILIDSDNKRKVYQYNDLFLALIQVNRKVNNIDNFSYDIEIDNDEEEFKLKYGLKKKDVFIPNNKFILINGVWTNIIYKKNTIHLNYDLNDTAILNKNFKKIILFNGIFIDSITEEKFINLENYLSQIIVNQEFVDLYLDEITIFVYEFLKQSNQMMNSNSLFRIRFEIFQMFKESVIENEVPITSLIYLYE